MIVVGSGNSSNSVRLVEVALEAGAKAAYRVDDASEIDEAWLDGVRTRQRHLGRQRARGAGRRACWPSCAERGYPDATAVHSAEESLIFSLPKELRRDLKAAAAAAQAERERTSPWPASSTSTPTTRSRGCSRRSSTRCATTR